MTEPFQDTSSAVILVVDDEPTNLALVEDLLAREGYDNVHLVNDPRMAMATFEQVQPDLVLLDLQMPHLDGFALMDHIGQAVGGEEFLPVLVLTADPARDTRRRALAQGATDFMTKPLDTAEAALRVRNLLHARLLHLELEREKRRLEDRVAERTQALQEANEALRDADQVKTDFIAVASHEMRTPLTVIKGFSEILRNRWQDIDDCQRNKHLETMNRNADRLERLVNDLLLAARIETAGEDDDRVVELRPTSFDLADHLARTIADSPLDPTDVQLHCPPESYVRADAGLIDEIIDNLLSNADKYGTPPVHVQANTSRGTIEIAVRDHGPGVPDEFVPQLFERFTQASSGDRRTATGTGLGLWVARRLAHLHGGDLNYEDASPGSCFRIRIPQLHARTAPEPDEQADG